MDNDFITPVLFEGEMYPSAAHAYQAAKSADDRERRRIRKMPMIKEMYQIARTIQEPADWQLHRLKVMETILRDKFRRNPELR